MIGLMLTAPARMKFMFMNTPEEGGDAGQDPEDQAKADQNLTKGDDIRESGGDGQRDVLHEPAIPALHRRVRPGRLGERALEETGERGSRMVRENPGIARMLSKRADINGIAGQLFGACYQPLPANIQTNDQPEPGHTGVGEQEPRDGRFGNVRGSTGLHVIFIILMIFTSVKDEPCRKDTYVECPAKLRLVQGLSFDTLSIPLSSHGKITATPKSITNTSQLILCSLPANQTNCVRQPFRPADRR